MTWITPLNSPFTVDELLSRGLSVPEAMWIAASVPMSPGQARLVSVDGFRVEFKECAMEAFCSQCGDEFDPIEGVVIPQDPDEPRFCSSECGENRTAYLDARYSGAPAL